MDPGGWTLRLPQKVLLAVLAVVLAACGSRGTAATTVTADTGATTTTAPATAAEASTTTAPSADVNLVLWTDESRSSVVNEVATAFTDVTGVRTTVETKELGHILDQMLRAGPDGEGADVFIGAHDWVGELAAKDVVEPMDLGAKSGEFEPVALDAFSYQGSLYAVPFATEAIAFYYNTDLVPEAPATFEELAGICGALEGVANCVGVSGGADAPDAYHNYPFVSALGGYVFGYDPVTGYDTTDVGLDSEGAIAGISFLEEQIAAGVIGPTNYDTAKALFRDRLQPFWMAGPWEVEDLEGQTGVNWAVTKIPTIGGNPPAPLVAAHGFFLSASSENKGVAQSFLIDFIATPDIQQALYDADPRNPAYTSVIEGLAGDPVAVAFAASAADGNPVPNVPEMRAVWMPLGEQIRLVRNGELAALEAMTAAATTVREAIGNPPS